MLFSVAPGAQQFIFDPPLVINNNIIECVNEVKYLGVHLDNRLTFAAHTNKKVAAAKSALGALRRSVKCHLPSVIKSVYQSIVKPSLLYACTVTYPINITDRYRLERVQSYAAKLVLNRFDLSYSEMLSNLKWKSIVRTVCERRCITFYKYVHGLRFLPSEYIVVQSSVRTTRQSNSNHSLVVSVPCTKLTRTTKTCLYISSCIWNRLSESVINVNVTKLLLLLNLVIFRTNVLMLYS